MELIYAELTVVWVVAVVFGAILAIYHAGLVAYDVVKNLVENRRLRAVNQLTSQAVNAQVDACLEAVE